MSVLEATVEPDIGARSRRMRHRWIVGSVVGLALLVWWATPGTMPSNSGEPMYSGVAPPTGEALYVDLGLGTSPGEGPVHVMWARPIVSIGKSYTRAELVTCRRGSEGGVGIVWGDVSDICLDERPAAGVTIHSEDQLLLKVVSDDAWPAVVDGVQIAYVDGWRPGFQRAGSPLVLSAVGP